MQYNEKKPYNIHSRSKVLSAFLVKTWNDFKFYSFMEINKTRFSGNEVSFPPRKKSQDVTYINLMLQQTIDAPTLGENRLNPNRKVRVSCLASSPWRIDEYLKRS